MLICSVCKNGDDNKKIVARELMFGYNDEFIYWECGKCKRLEIEKTPEDLEKYYPIDKYYSFTGDNIYTDSPKSLKNKVEKVKANFILFGKNKIAGRILSFNYKKPKFYGWLKISGVTPGSAILDVGCGKGILLNKLRRIGFVNLTGIDPFNKKTIEVEGMSIYSKNIFQITGQYNLIISNHSFEHMPEPEKHLEQLKTLLKPDGVLLIRTPVTNSFFWERYGIYWVALDPPRHLHIESHKSMEMLCNKAGLRITKIVHDAEAFQFIASEQYIKGIKLNDNNSFVVHKNYSLFSKQTIKTYEKQVADLNDKFLGGEASFYIKKNV